MESRTRFAIGGMSTVVASVAVVCAVALTNSVALAESAGVPVGATPLVLPSPLAAARTAAPTDTPEVPAVSATATPSPSPLVPAARGPETVPAPAPIVVSSPAPQVETSAESALAAAESSGSWAPVREWAQDLGWSQSRIDAWIQKLEDKQAAAAERTSQNNQDQKASTGQAGRLTASDLSSKASANAEKDAERQSVNSGFGSKKDQSRESPARRD